MCLNLYLYLYIGAGVVAFSEEKGRINLDPHATTVPRGSQLYAGWSMDRREQKCRVCDANFSQQERHPLQS